MIEMLGRFLCWLGLHNWFRFHNTQAIYIKGYYLVCRQCGRIVE